MLSSNFLNVLRRPGYLLVQSPEDWHWGQEELEEEERAEYFITVGALLREFGGECGTNFKDIY